MCNDSVNMSWTQDILYIDNMHAGRESPEQPKVSHFLGQLHELCINERC